MEAPPAAEEARRVSANEIDYAKYVLYVRKGIPACERLLGLAAQSLDVIVQDVDNISGPKPAWLRGVPSLVELPGFKLSTGTEALEAMEAHVRLGIQGMPTGLFGGSAGASLSEDQGAQGGLARMGLDLTISGDKRYEDAPRERNAGGSSLEEMMRRRAASSKSLQLP
jgi:hypothetical protein